MFGVALLFVSRFAAVVGTPLVGLLVVRYLGPETFGQYAAASAVTGALAFLCDFGVQQAILRFGARESHIAPVLLRGGLVSFGYTLLTALLVLAWMHAFSYDPLVRRLVYIQCLGFLRGPLLTVASAGLQLRGEYGRVAWWNLSSTIALWAGTLAAMAAGASVTAVVAAPIAASLVLLVFMTVAEGKRLGLFRRSGGFSDSGSFVKETWKFGSAGTMYQIYHKGDAAILSAARPPIEVGYYSVVGRLTELFDAVPGIVFNQVLYPKYFQWSRRDRERLASYYRLSTKLVVWVGVHASSFLILLGADLVRVLFGMDDAVIRALVPLMAMSVMFNFWAASPGAVLTTDDHVMRKLRVQAVVAGIALALNVAFIPIYGILAAGAVFTLSKLLLGIQYTREVAALTKFAVFGDAKSRAGFAAFAALVILGSVALSGATVGIRILGLLAGAGASSILVWSVWLTPEERSEVLRLLLGSTFGRGTASGE